MTSSSLSTETQLQRMAGEIGRLQQLAHELQQSNLHLNAEVQETRRVLSTGRGSNQPVNPTPRAKVPDPPTYDGSSKANEIEVWKFLLLQYFLATGIEDQIAQVNLASTLLRGNAALWFISHYSADARPESFEALTRALTDQFGDKDAVKKARDQLCALRQTKSARVYTNKFRQLLIQIPDIGDSDVLDKYIRGLKMDIQKEVWLKNPSSLDEAIQLAERVDSLFQGLKFGNARPAYAKSPVFQSDAMDVDNVQYTPSKGRLTSKDRAQLKANGGCFYCRQLGHVLKNCPVRPSRSQVNAISENSGNASQE